MSVLVPHRIGRIVQVRFRKGWFGKCIVQIRREKYVDEAMFDLDDSPIVLKTNRRSLGVTDWRDLNGDNFSELIEAYRFLGL